MPPPEGIPKPVQHIMLPVRHTGTMASTWPLSGLSNGKVAAAAAPSNMLSKISRVSGFVAAFWGSKTHCRLISVSLPRSPLHPLLRGACQSVGPGAPTPGACRAGFPPCPPSRSPESWVRIGPLRSRRARWPWREARAEMHGPCCTRLSIREPDDGYCSHSGGPLAATPVLAAAAQSDRLPNRTFLPLRPGA